MNLKRRNLLLIVLTVVIIYAVINVIIGCPFRNITGIPCPACGLTRATVCLFKGDIASAFKFNPLFPLAYLLMGALCVYAALAIKNKGINKRTEKIFSVIFSAVLVIFIVVWIFRFAAGTLI